MGILKKAARLIGPALLVYIFIRFIDLPLLINTFLTASLLYLFLSFLLTVIIFILKIIRIYLPLRKSGVNVKKYYFAKLFVSTRLLGWVSNAFLSDIVNAGMLIAVHEQKIRISNIFIINRVADTLATIALFVAVFYFNIHIVEEYVHISYRNFIIAACIISVVLPALFFFRKKAIVYLKDFYSTGKDFLFSIIILTVAAVVCSILNIIVDAKALHLDISASYLLLCYIVGTGITVLPISLSGIGAREIAFIFLMKLIDIPSEKAIALSFLEFIIIPFLSLAFLYAVSSAGVIYENRHNR